MKYGIIGLGNLGGKIAANLLDEGFELQVHDLRPELAERHIARGAVWCDSPAEAATGVDGLITSLTSPKVSTAVMTGPNGALAALSPGATWIETSTTEVDELLRIAALARERGIGTLEAPVTGGVHRAERGEITVLIGGCADELARHQAAIAAFGDPIIHLGDIGAASTLKVITNMLAFVNMIGMGEGLMLAKRAGLDLGQAYRAIQASSGNSVEFETVAPVILNGSFDTSFTLALACKDLGLMMELGRKHDVPLKFTGLMDQMFLEAKAKYGADAWTPHVIKMMEDATGVELRSPGFPDKMMDAQDVKAFCESNELTN
ncbi:NAD(P)-dependent oxidoreductase [Roseovarius sp. ZX-A-9]|uniref:NAD(P)-dependent oxidoreductase n=1 Tax=Roseovarius sp. ZX-A-9 TaxID=3014783 RepID=UPI00232C896B|nr:NAD(P)-dependent oxidoreductase [Roseovarius sp. ZX-A-9]